MNTADEKTSFQKLIRALKLKRILRTRKKKGSKESDDDDASLLLESDSDYDDFVGVESDNVQFLFRFVGVIFYKDRVINVYPKYIESSSELKEEMRQVLRVLLKHQGKKYYLGVPEMLETEEQKNEINMLSIMLFLLNDYAENGLYSEDESIIEYNGEGVIDWQRTVDMTYPLIESGAPYYVDFFTRRKIENDMNYCVRLHKYVLTEATSELELLGLTDIFNLPVLDLSDEECDSFGEFDTIIEKIDAEMAVQFDDRKSAVLKALLLYINQKDKRNTNTISYGEDELDFFGTRAFHSVWESVIDDVYVSQKKMTFETIKNEYVPKFGYSIKLPNNGTAYIDPQMELGSIIERPEWNLKEESKSVNTHAYYPKDTFIPDYLRFNEACDEFYILDAKYYLPRWYLTSDGGAHIYGQPGVEDVAKQYMYYLAYRPLLKHNGIDIRNVKNYFVMPTELEDEDMGFTRLGFLADILPNIFDIRVKMLNAKTLFSHYLNNDKLDVTSIV